MAEMQQMLMGEVQAVIAGGSARGRARAGGHEGHIPGTNHPPTFETPALERPDEERQRRNGALARIQHIFCTSFILGSRLTVLAEAPQNDLA